MMPINRNKSTALQSIFVGLIVCPPLPRNTYNRMKLKKNAFYNYVLIK